MEKRAVARPTVRLVHGCKALTASRCTSGRCDRPRKDKPVNDFRDGTVVAIESFGRWPRVAFCGVARQRPTSAATVRRRRRTDRTAKRVRRPTVRSRSTAHRQPLRPAAMPVARRGPRGRIWPWPSIQAEKPVLAATRNGRRNSTARNTAQSNCSPGYSSPRTSHRLSD